MNKIDLIIDALERIDRGHYPPTCVITEALAAARELKSLAQPEQEPIAWVAGYKEGNCVVVPVNGATVLPTGLALFTAPPKREWFDLTKEELIEIDEVCFEKFYGYVESTDFTVIARAIEAKIKEKNHD